MWHPKFRMTVHELIKNPLTQVNEIERIEITGGNSLQVSIDFDYLKMQRYGISSRIRWKHCIKPIIWFDGLYF